MKFTFLLIILFFLNSNGSAKKEMQSTPYNNFLNFVVSGFKPGNAVKNNCEWQYILVAVSVDKSNKISKYTILNDTAIEMKNYFKFLLGYKFPVQLHVNNHPVVFCISIENNKQECLVSQKKYTPTEVLRIVFSNLQPTLKSDPKTVFIPNIIELAYSFDPIR